MVEVVRPAAPPTIVGVKGSNAAIVLPPATRVESFAFSQSVGRWLVRPVSGRPSCTMVHAS